MFSIRYKLSISYWLGILVGEIANWFTNTMIRMIYYPTNLLQTNSFHEFNEALLANAQLSFVHQWLSNRFMYKYTFNIFLLKIFSIIPLKLNIQKLCSSRKCKHVDLQFSTSKIHHILFHLRMLHMSVTLSLQWPKIRNNEVVWHTSRVADVLFKDHIKSVV